ncbi:hypothetical protein HanXRQr2_Chr08g0342661 [Helianthus annuus]|uniref:Uncharacterized protein n=1 Tax=Helianthus annuus TaxID=4232 RepID=A0A9K3IF28_HELAN|nr:hypothetical protein HanXRQr2_Chr08g0342661 [Helianthus annuus]KAJ0901921.1 hypothetical protein HanPSC8_Chr08g0330981 [Helianthus annuus]
MCRETISCNMNPDVSTAICCITRLGCYIICRSFMIQLKTTTRTLTLSTSLYHFRCN